MIIPGREDFFLGAEVALPGISPSLPGILAIIPGRGDFFLGTGVALPGISPSLPGILAIIPGKEDFFLGTGVAFPGISPSVGLNDNIENNTNIIFVRINIVLVPNEVFCWIVSSTFSNEE